MKPSARRSAQAQLDDLVDPERLADPARRRRPAGVWRSFRPQKSPSASPSGGEVAAERVQLLVAARDPLLHERVVRPRALVTPPRARPASRSETPAGGTRGGSRRVRRLDEHREPELARSARRPCGGTGTPAARAALELEALALDPLEHVPGGNGQRKRPPSVVEAAGDDVQVLVVRREDRRRTAERVAELRAGARRSPPRRRPDRGRAEAGSSGSGTRARCRGGRARSPALPRGRASGSPRAVHPVDVGHDGRRHRLPQASEFARWARS